MIQLPPCDHDECPPTRCLKDNKCRHGIPLDNPCDECDEERGLRTGKGQAGEKALHDAAQRLREYLESPACVLPGLDVPDEIWIPFTTALDAPNDKLTPLPAAAGIERNQKEQNA